MNVYQILSLLFGSGLLTAILKAFWSKIKVNEKKTESVQLGVQALLRDRLYYTYTKYEEKGFAPIYARENFENMYQQYHILGAMVLWMIFTINLWLYHWKNKKARDNYE